MDGPHQALVGRRIAFIAAVAIISVWANYEASKGVEIVVVNGVGLDTPLGRRLSLLLVSDDSATRAVLRAARLSRRRLYAADDPVKPVRRITVRLTSTTAGAPNFRSALAEVSVERRPGDEYAVAVGVGGERWEKGEVVGAIERGVARVWVWDGGAPAEVVEGVAAVVVEGGGGGGGGGPWRELLGCCERWRRGFIGRLNRAMRDGWDDDRTVDDALGMTARQVCGAYRNLSSFGRVVDGKASW